MATGAGLSSGGRTRLLPSQKVTFVRQATGLSAAIHVTLLLNQKVSCRMDLMGRIPDCGAGVEAGIMVEGHEHVQALRSAHEQKRIDFHDRNYRNGTDETCRILAGVWLVVSGRNLASP